MVAVWGASNQSYTLTFVLLSLSFAPRNRLFVEMRHDSLTVGEGQVEHWVSGVLGEKSVNAGQRVAILSSRTTRFTASPRICDAPSSSVHASASANDVLRSCSFGESAPMRSAFVFDIGRDIRRHLKPPATLDRLGHVDPVED